MKTYLRATEQPIRILSSMGSHSVTCHPTQVNAFRHKPNQTERHSIYLPRRDRRLSWP